MLILKPQTKTKKPKLKTKTNKEERFKRYIKLGWDIMYHKCLYYELTDKMFEPLRIKDRVFDMMCNEYEKLAKKLKREASATDMVGFDMSRPSSRLVLGKVYIDYHFLPKTKHKGTKTNVRRKKS